MLTVLAYTLGVLLFEQLLALLDNGQPLTTDAVERSLAMLQRSEGKPAEVRANPRVVEAYLGKAASEEG